MPQITRRSDGRYQVVIPAKESPTGKRQHKYFNQRTSNRDDVISAERFLKEHQANRKVHGDHAVTPEELHWINISRNALGSLPKLGEVLEHWRKTGANIHSISARDGVEEFLSWKIASNHEFHHFLASSFPNCVACCHPRDIIRCELCML